MHHNNYYFIRRLSTEIAIILKGAVLYDCYSQNKDELVLGFVLPDKREYFIIANLGSEFSCLQFSEEVHRAKRNTITLFEEILGLEVLHVNQIANERSFNIVFESGFELVFKLFGNRANIILFKDQENLKIFKNNLKQDKTFRPQNRIVDGSIENLSKQGFELPKVFFTFDDLFVKYFDTQGYNQSSDNGKYELIQKTLTYLENPLFYITRVNEKVVLSLFPIGEIMETHQSAIKAINAFYSAHFRFNFLLLRKNKVLSVLKSRINNGQAYLEKTRAKLDELEKEKSPSHLADVLMANLHQISQGTEKVKLFDFYSGNEIEIKLKKDLTPQKNAELLYKKAKKKPLEKEMLLEQIINKETILEKLEEDLSLIEQIQSHKNLEPFEELYSRKDEKEEKDITELFKTFELMGFQIWVGRNASNNDELTQKYAHKNDLWLHAKDVAGSHVVVKFQSGKKFPKPVIEAAASLAAYYSKRKNETLCPVMYTEKKYVRKVKGAPAGQVVVAKETVIMVVPKGEI